MERAKEKKQKNKPPKFPAGGVMVDRGEKTGDHSIEFVIGKDLRKHYFRLMEILLFSLVK